MGHEELIEELERCLNRMEEYVAGLDADEAEGLLTIEHNVTAHISLAYLNLAFAIWREVLPCKEE